MVATFYALPSNLAAQDPNNLATAPSVTVNVRRIDGYTRLSVFAYQEPTSMTIELVDGVSVTTTFRTPRFQDDTATDIVLLDPDSPARVITFKVNDGSNWVDASAYVTYSVVDNTDPYSIQVALLRKPTNTLASFVLVPCFSFGDYPNLADLCDYNVAHTVVNAAITITVNNIADPAPYTYGDTMLVYDLAPAFTSSDPAVSFTCECVNTD